MLKEIFGVAEKANTRPLLIVFAALSLATLQEGAQLLKDPFQWSALMLPIAVFSAFGVVWGGFVVLHRLYAALPDNDIMSWGPVIGCSILAFCLLVSFQYLSTHPQGLSFELLSAPGFVRLLMLYLLAVETIKVRRHY